MVEFKAPSGAKVKINVADWQDSMTLKSAIMKELSNSGMNVDWSAQFTKQIKDSDVTEIVRLFMIVDSSKDVYKALFDCLKRCTHNGEAITEYTFDDVKNRQDYYEIAFQCIKVNFSPFVSGLRSRLNTIFQTVKAQKGEDLPQ